MKKPILLFVSLVVAVLAVYISTKAQRQSGQVVRLRIQKVTEQGVLPRTIQGDPDVIGFSCAAVLDGTEPTCYALLRDRAF